MTSLTAISTSSLMASLWWAGRYGDREEEQALLKTLEETDVSVAECAYEEDRQLMLGVIESTYAVGHHRLPFDCDRACDWLPW